MFSFHPLAARPRAEPITGTQVVIGVTSLGEIFDSPGISDAFTVAASSNSSCLVGTTPTGVNPTTGASQPTDTTSPSLTSSGSASQPTDTTSPSLTSSGSSHSNIAPIGGGAAGGGTALLLIGLRLWYSWRRRQPSNTVIPTTIPGFGTHAGATTIAGAAASISVTGRVSIQNPVLSQMGYQTHAYDPSKPLSALMVVGGGSSGWRNEGDNERRIRNGDELGASEFTHCVLLR
ncbi:hypothetical protein C8R45DRAFT_921928 [Mycena sanguinolenta]|nr:hypothetical protein C8R45DRAFT_921928 [Mycena sanguinolenta]